MVIKITLKHSIFQWSLIHVKKFTSMINSNGSCQVLVWCVVAIGMRAGSNTNKYPTHWDWYSYCIINSAGEPKLGEWCKVKGAGVRAWETIFIKWLKDYMFAQVTWPLLHYCRWARELLAGINPPYSTFLTRECVDARLTLSTGSSAGKGVRFRQHDSMSLTPVVTGSQAWAGQVRLFKLDKVALILSIIFF